MGQNNDTVTFAKAILAATPESRSSSPEEEADWREGGYL